MSSQEDIIIDLRYNWLKVRQELHLLDQISLYSSTWEMKKWAMSCEMTQESRITPFFGKLTLWCRIKMNNQINYYKKYKQNERGIHKRIVQINYLYEYIIVHMFEYSKSFLVKLEIP